MPKGSSKKSISICLGSETVHVYFTHTIYVSEQNKMQTKKNLINSKIIKNRIPTIEELFLSRRRRQDLHKADGKDANFLSVAIGHRHGQIRLRYVPYEEVFADLRKKRDRVSENYTKPETAPTQLHEDWMGSSSLGIIRSVFLFLPPLI